ncbi:bicarbonate transporter [Chloropicon primus]|nr:bicarbonate transporter [Chloropicon primus]
MREEEEEVSLGSFLAEGFVSSSSSSESEQETHGGQSVKDFSLDELDAYGRSTSFSSSLHSTLRWRRTQDAILLRQSPKVLEKDLSILHFKGEKLHLKNVALEIQAEEDLLALGQCTGLEANNAEGDEEEGQGQGRARKVVPGSQKLFAHVLHNVREDTAEGLVKRFAEVVKTAAIYDVAVLDSEDRSARALRCTDGDAYTQGLIDSLEGAIILEKGCSKKSSSSIFRCDVLHGRGFMVLSLEDRAANLVPTGPIRRAAVLIKLKQGSVWGTTGQKVHVVVLVVCSASCASTANHLSTAHTFATMLSSDVLLGRLVESSCAEDLLASVLLYVAVTKSKKEKWLNRRQTKREKEESTRKLTLGQEIQQTSVTFGREAPETRRRRSCCPRVPKTEREIERQKMRAKESSLVFSGRCLGAVNDIVRLSRHYRKEWVVRSTVNDWFKIVSGTFWQLFSTLAPAISIGLVYEEVTDGQIGVKQMLIAESCCGIIYALSGSLSLGVYRSTGPLLSYIKILYRGSIELPFLLFYVWTGLWLGFFLVIGGLFEASVLMKFCGRFTEEVLAMMVSMVFIVSAIEDLAIQIGEAYDLSYVTLFVGTFGLSTFFARANGSRFARKIIRSLITDLAPAISFLVMTGFSFAVPGRDPVARVPMGETGGTFSQLSLLPVSIQWNQALFCAIPGFLVALLFMIESNVGALLTCRPELKLRKGLPCMHHDLVLSGLLVVGCSLLGLPWCMVSLPHSPMNAIVLADTDGEGNILKSRECRWPGLVSHLAMLAIVGWADHWIAQIPVGVAFGYLLYMGIESMRDNDMFQRVLLLVTDPLMYPPNHYVRFVRFGVVLRFTAIQVLCFLVLWLVHDNFYSAELDELPFSVAMLFPLVLVALIPFRMFVLPFFFTPLDLELLTQVEEGLVARLFY